MREYEDDEDDDPAYEVRGDKPGPGFGIAALVLGSIALLFSCLCGIFALPFGILAIVFGSLGLKREGYGMAMAGLIAGVVALCLIVLFLAFGMGMMAMEKMK